MEPPIDVFGAGGRQQERLDLMICSSFGLNHDNYLYIYIIYYIYTIYIYILYIYYIYILSYIYIIVEPDTGCASHFSWEDQERQYLFHQPWEKENTHINNLVYIYIYIIFTWKLHEHVKVAHKVQAVTHDSC